MRIKDQGIFSLTTVSVFVLGWLCCVSASAAAAPATLDAQSFRIQVNPDAGSYEIQDKQSQQVWRSNPFRARFGEVAVKAGGKTQRQNLERPQVKQTVDQLELTFAVTGSPDAGVRVMLRSVDGGQALECAYEASPGLTIESIRLLDDALWVTDADQGYVVVPVREGLLVPADSGLNFTHRFDTFAYEGCHMEMLGIVKRGSAALITWHDPYVAAELKSAVTNAPGVEGKQVLAPSLVLRQSAKVFRVQFLGNGDYVKIAQAYQKVAQAKGWRVPWSEKLKQQPERAKLFGAVNFKLWSTLSRQMSEDSSREQSVKVNWTFDEAAKVAEHLRFDLQLEKVLFMMGGWIRRGYDNQHPDILPTAPECGGDVAFADCARRVMNLGYIFSLHDNYQDIYKDAPSWNEQYIMKQPDGSLAKGGHWAGGVAYLTCAQKALELAKRPQNLAAVKKLSNANSYFIDTTYAAGLQECFDQNHPLTRWDDMKWKQALSDYAREVFGIFGSECGREWAIPHSDFFEGMTGVSGTYYHNKDLVKQLGGTVVPLFELVYRDCIAMYGKYGYDVSQAAEYVLHHLAIGRPLHYHSVPPHLYWEEATNAANALQVRPLPPTIQQTGPRQFSVVYYWDVERTPPMNPQYDMFVHFTDAAGNIKFQHDHEATPYPSEWQPGKAQDGPYQVEVPAGLTGAFEVRLGLMQTNGTRALLQDRPEKDRAYTVGKLEVAGNKITFTPLKSSPRSGTPDVFARGDQGWTAGMHRLDRFVKNTYEILSPLYELTAQMPMTSHRFLTRDRKVQHSTFGSGAQAVEVVVNGAQANYTWKSQRGGQVTLPPYGFVVESASFAAFHALNWNGIDYADAPLFTLRGMDGAPVETAKELKVFHGFGDPRVRLGTKVLQVEKDLFQLPQTKP